jgi:hypothetical protein
LGARDARAGGEQRGRGASRRPSGRPAGPSVGPSTVHEGLVGARALVGTRYLADPARRAEYARDIAPRTEIALSRILAEAYGPLSPPGRAIDLGAGTGAVGRALRARFGPEFEVVEVDVVDAPGVRRADLARELPSVAGRFDLVVAAHLLNELYVNQPAPDRIRRRADRVLAWREALLADGGTVVLLEPALRETSRELLAVRDRLVEGGMFVVAPCLRQASCPALAKERDWCHDAAPDERRGRVDFSYLVLRGGPDGAEEPAEASDPRFRVVSDPLPEKGRLRVWGCGVRGRGELIRLDRHASAENADFDEVRRGDVLTVRGESTAGDGFRIGENTTVVRRR